MFGILLVARYAFSHVRRYSLSVGLKAINHLIEGQALKENASNRVYQSHLEAAFQDIFALFHATLLQHLLCLLERSPYAVAITSSRRHKGGLSLENTLVLTSTTTTNFLASVAS